MFLADLTTGRERGSLADQWERLGRDAASAYRAGLALISSGDEAAEFLSGRFGPAPEEDAGLHQLISDLNSGRHVIRRDAFAALARRGAEAIPALKAGLRGAKDERTRRAIRELLGLPGAAAAPGSPRWARAAWVLDRIGTARAAEAKRRLAA